MANAYLGTGAQQNNVTNNVGNFIVSEEADIFINNAIGSTASGGSIMVVDTSSDDGYRVNTSTTVGAAAHCVLLDDCAHSQRRRYPRRRR